MSTDEPIREEIRWTPVSCRVADIIREHRLVRPYSSRTDLDGQWGEPEIYTEWGLDLDPEEAVLREWGYPSRFVCEPDRKPCRHEVPMPPERSES